MPKTVARATAFPVSRAPSEPAASRKTAPLVLVVDPDAGVRRMMAMVLQDSNCRIAGVPDGEAALAEAQDRAPALVLAEVRLPGMSGSDLARALRALDHPGTRIVLMSAYPRPPRDAEDEFLQKPLRIDRLIALVAEAVGQADGAVADEG